MNNQILHTLQRVYGYKEFRPQQEAIISAVLEKRDVLGLLPTGGGKSICYQIPGIILPGICIVISPLVSLIKDQIASLRAKGIKATGITGGISYEELDATLDNCIYGQYQFLYVSPERLQQDIVKQRISQMRVSLIAVDEAHCVSQWGHDFRPAYRKIHELREIHKEVPLIAVTATATTQVQEDLKQSLHMQHPAVFTASYKRKNIQYLIKKTTNKRRDLIQFYQEHTGSSVCYIRSRKNSIEFSNLLNSNSVSAQFYHGGLPHKQRQKTAESWMKNETQVMVATNAFGMGIDKPDVRSVTHLQLPDSIESYYQETGRAGRDGKPSVAQFFFNENDVAHARNQFVKSLPTPEVLKFIYRKLNNYLRIAQGEGAQQSYYFSFAQFTRTYDINGLQGYHALLALDRFSVLSFSQGHKRRCRIRFRESGIKITEFLQHQPDYNAILQSILRTYGGSQQQYVDINIALIAIRSNSTEELVVTALQSLKDKDLIDGEITDADSQITMLEPRDDDRTINRFAKELDAYNTIKIDKLNSLIHLLSDESECVNQVILNYFGEENSSRCGNCSRCESTQIDKVATLDIVATLKKEPLSIQELLSHGYDKEAIIPVIKRLLDQGKLILLPDQKYKWNG